MASGGHTGQQTQAPLRNVLLDGALPCRQSPPQCCVRQECPKGLVTGLAGSYPPCRGREVSCAGGTRKWGADVLPLLQVTLGEAEAR